MTALDDARGHLAKAHEFLDAAEVTHDLGLYNAATSNAVTSGINSKDAICLTLTGRTRKADDHRTAVPELRASGPIGREQASTLDRLLRLKPRSQYQPESIAASDAERSIRWAERLLRAEEGVVH
ncbi:MAG TPA: HEPN domain-containing protein [Kineosporiaceae bacterium]|nr:HEPN domain-containing protein [Kineosporiaceae bacterium]